MHDIAAALRVSIGLLLRRLRQVRPDDELTLPESSALARLDRGGPATPGALAKAGADQPAVHGGDARRAGGTRPGRAASGPGGRQAGGPVGHRAPAWRCCGTSATRGPSSWPRPCRPGSRPPNSGSWLRPHRCSSDWRRASDGGQAHHGRPVQVGGAVEHDRRRVHVRARRVHRHHRAAGHLPRHPPRSAGAGQRRLPAVDDHGLPAGPGRARGHRRPSRRHVRPGQDLQRRLRGVHRGLDPAVVRSVPRAPRRAVADRLAGARRRSAGPC